MAAAARPLYALLYDKWRVDELYDLVVVRPLRGVSNFCAQVVDRWVIDGTVRGVGLLPRGLGAVVRRAQTGVIHTYGAFFAVGMLALLGWAVARPAVSISYTAQGTSLTLQANGGPGYAYEWDLEGQGHYPPQDQFTAEARKTTTCHPEEAPDGRRVCRVGLRARNAFGMVTTTVRTIEINDEARQ
jgi:NADH-quinone oxidoreductase subunit L